MSLSFVTKVVFAIAVVAFCAARYLAMDDRPAPYDGEVGMTSTCKLSIADNSYLFPHEALRRDFLLGQRALKSMSADSNLEWQLEAFFTWWTHTSHVIHGHHDTEEKIWGPGLEELGVPRVDKVGADHRILMGLMDKVAEQESHFLESRHSIDALVKVRANVIEIWDHLTELMLAHLLEEENSCQTLLDAGITKAQLDALVQRIIAQTPADYLFSELAHFKFWLPRWARDANGALLPFHDEFLAEVPLPVRWITQLFYDARYADQLRLLQSIELGVPFTYDAGEFEGLRLPEVLLILSGVALVIAVALAALTLLLACLCPKTPSVSEAKAPSKLKKTQ